MQETRFFNRCLQTKLNTTFQTELLKGIVQMGGRIAIIVTDDPRYLSRKLRTWTTMRRDDLHQTRQYNSHSKLAFIVQDLKELPAIAPFLSCVTLMRDSKNKRVTALRCRKYPTGISTDLGNLEVFLNQLAGRPEPSHFLGSRTMPQTEPQFVLNCDGAPKSRPGIMVIGMPNTKRATKRQLREDATTEGSYHHTRLDIDLFRNDN